MDLKLKSLSFNNLPFSDKARKGEDRISSSSISHFRSEEKIL